MRHVWTLTQGIQEPKLATAHRMVGGPTSPAPPSRLGSDFTSLLTLNGPYHISLLVYSSLKLKAVACERSSFKPASPLASTEVLLLPTLRYPRIAAVDVRLQRDLAVGT